MVTEKRKSELACLALSAAGIHDPLFVMDDGSIKEVSEIEKVEEKFKNPNILEVQVWKENTASYFKARGYNICHCDDGSYWICDDSRLWD